MQNKFISSHIKRPSTKDKELSMSQDSGGEHINHGNCHLESNIYTKQESKQNSTVNINGSNQKKRDSQKKKDVLNLDISLHQLPKGVKIDKKQKVNFNSQNPQMEVRYNESCQQLIAFSPSTKKNTDQMTSINQEQQKCLQEVKELMNKQNGGKKLNSYDRSSHQKINQPKWISNKDTLSQTFIDVNLQTDSRNSMLPFVAIQGRQSQELTQLQNSSKVFTGILPKDFQNQSLASLKPQQTQILGKARYQSRIRGNNGKQSYRNNPGGNFTLQSTKDFLHQTQNNSQVLEQKKQRLAKLNQREYQKFMLDNNANLNQQIGQSQNFESSHNIVHYLNVFQKEKEMRGSSNRLSPVNRAKNMTEDVNVAKGATDLETGDQGYQILRKTGMSSAINYSSKMSHQNNMFNKTQKPLRRSIKTTSFNKDQDLLEKRYSSLKRSMHDEQSILKTDYTADLKQRTKIGLQPTIHKNRDKYSGTVLGLTNQTGYGTNVVGLQNVTYSNFTQMGKTNAHSQMSQSKQVKKQPDEQNNIQLSYDSSAGKTPKIDDMNDEYICKSYYQRPKQDINKDSHGYFHRKSQSQLNPTASPQRERGDKKSSPFVKLEASAPPMMPKLDLESFLNTNNAFTAHLDGLTREIQHELSSRRQENGFIESYRSGSDRKSKEKQLGFNLNHVDQSPFGMREKDSRAKMAQTSYRGHSKASDDDYKSVPRSMRERQSPTRREMNYKIKKLEDKLITKEFEIIKRTIIKTQEHQTQRSEITVQAPDQGIDTQFTILSEQDQKDEGHKQVQNVSLPSVKPLDLSEIPALHIPQISENHNVELLQCHQKLSLYLDILGDFRKTVVKKVEKDIASFLEIMVKRITQIKDEYFKETDDLSKNMGLLQIDLENQKQINLNISYENMILKSKESTYMELITAAKKDDKHFQEKFQMAHDFLNGQRLETFVQNLETEYALSLDDNMLELSEKVFQLRPSLKESPKRLNESKGEMPDVKKEETAPGLGADEFAFSEVTKILKATHDGQQAQLRIPPIHLSNQIEFKESTLEIFIQEITKRCGSVQVETGKRLWNKLEKHTKFCDQGVQASSEELDNAIDEQFADLGQQLLAQRKEVARLGANMRDLELESIRQVAEIAKQKVAIRVSEKEKNLALEEAQISNENLANMHNEKGLAEAQLRTYQQELIAQKLQKESLKHTCMNLQKQQAQTDLKEAAHSQEEEQKNFKLVLDSSVRKLRGEDSSNVDYDAENDYIDDTVSNQSNGNSQNSRLSRSRGLKRKRNDIKVVAVGDLVKGSEQTTIKNNAGGSSAHQSNADIRLSPNQKGTANNSLSVGRPGSKQNNKYGGAKGGKNSATKPASRNSRNRSNRQDQNGGTQHDRSLSQNKRERQ